MKGIETWSIWKQLRFNIQIYMPLQVMTIISKLYLNYYWMKKRHISFLMKEKLKSQFEVLIEFQFHLNLLSRSYAMKDALFVHFCFLNVHKICLSPDGRIPGIHFLSLGPEFRRKLFIMIQILCTFIWE